ncbi:MULTISPECIES: hypothetical protein [Flavobacterium]|nr:hypothetical protein [Flavobacterium sp. N1846]
MRKITLCIMCCFVSLANSQTRGIIGGTNWLKNWTNFKPKTTEYNEASNVLAGVISQNMMLYKKNTYLLMGNVYVANGATLFIEPGTVIRGDFETGGTLVITKNAKVIALGNETDPIVFTSNRPSSERKPGDWGGIVVMGEATTNNFTGRLDLNIESQYNNYGGSKDEGDSGILKYVRIEFAGKKGKNGLNNKGLSLAGLGSKSIVSNVQVSFCNDDAFVFYGGILTVDNLVSFKNMNTDYEFTEGAQSIITNSLTIKNPYSSRPGESRCLEVKSYEVASKADLSKRFTNIIANNITLVNESVEGNGLIKEAILIKENCSFNISNSVVSGFSQSVLFDKGFKVKLENLEKIKLRGLLFNNCSGYVVSENSEYNQQIKNWYSANNNVIEYSTISDVALFSEIDLKKLPDYRIKDPINTTRLATN